MTRLVRRAGFAIGITIGAVFAMASPAAAHTVTATIFAVPPVCTPTCAHARSVLFRASVRIDSCNVVQCFLPVRATVWPQIHDGGWTNARPKKTNIKVLEVGERINLTITVGCGGMGGETHRFRTRSYGEAAVGGHTFIAANENPNRSEPVRVHCGAGQRTIRARQLR